MANLNKPWTADDDRKLTQMLGAGRSMMAISAALRRSRSAIKSRIATLRKAANEPTLDDPDQQQHER
jgi:hypothetical protein